MSAGRQNQFLCQSGKSQLNHWGFFIALLIVPFFCYIIILLICCILHGVYLLLCSFLMLDNCHYGTTPKRPRWPIIECTEQKLFHQWRTDLDFCSSLNWSRFHIEDVEQWKGSRDWIYQWPKFRWPVLKGCMSVQSFQSHFCIIVPPWTKCNQIHMSFTPVDRAWSKFNSFSYFSSIHYLLQFRNKQRKSNMVPKLIIWDALLLLSSHPCPHANLLSAWLEAFPFYLPFYLNAFPCPCLPLSLCQAQGLVAKLLCYRNLWLNRLFVLSYMVFTYF